MSGADRKCRVVFYNLRVASCELRVVNLRVAIPFLRVAKQFDEL